MERAAIIGTAQSWIKTPWQDKSLYLVSLNDAYRMPGFVRADAWYDLHPLNKFYIPEIPGKVLAHQVPPGYYVRPAEHLDWLASQTIPVILHPDYQSQHPAAKEWAHAQPFPKAELEQEFGRYFTSSPAWILAHLVSQGVKELHIYGIHLATEHEYIEQRPNFEYLIGRVLGHGKVTQKVADGLRHYETPDGLVVLPEASPILNSNFQYAFEPRPRAVLEPLKWELHKIAIKHKRASDALRARKWFLPKAPIVKELRYLEAWRADVDDQLHRAADAAGA